MTEREWVEKIKKECVLNVGNFDTRYAIQLVGRSGSKIGIVSLNKRFMSVDVIDKLKYERFYDKFYSLFLVETMFLKKTNFVLFSSYFLFLIYFIFHDLINF